MPYKTSNPRVSQNKDNTRSWWQIPNLSGSPNPSESVAPAFLQLPSYMIASYWCSKIQLNIKKNTGLFYFFQSFPHVSLRYLWHPHAAASLSSTLTTRVKQGLLWVLFCSCLFFEKQTWGKLEQRGTVLLKVVCRADCLKAGTTATAEQRCKDMALSTPTRSSAHPAGVFMGDGEAPQPAAWAPHSPPQSRVRCCSVTAGCMGGLCRAPTYVSVKSQLKLCSLEWIFIATFLTWMPSLTGWGCQEAYNDLSKNVLWRHSKILWCFPAPCIPAAMRTKHWLDFILALHFIKQYMKRTKINQSENTEQSIQEPDNVSYTDANI